MIYALFDVDGQVDVAPELGVALGVMRFVTFDQVVQLAGESTVLFASMLEANPDAVEEEYHGAQNAGLNVDGGYELYITNHLDEYDLIPVFVVQCDECLAAGLCDGDRDALAKLAERGRLYALVQ